MVLAEDRSLARLFKFLDRKVTGGLKNVLFVLTADHGMAPNSEWLAKNRIDAGAIDQAELKVKLENKLREKFGSPGKTDWIPYAVDFNFWISRDALKERKISLEIVSREVKRLLLQEKAFAYAFTAEDVALRQLPPGLHERRILKTYVPGRSGDVIGIGRPFYYVKEHNSNHMADYSYDETVPLIIAGAGVKSGKFATKADIVDIAPTLSLLLGVVAPTLSEGRVLSEALLPCDHGCNKQK
jgi:predicted AlkP superfamily pyrophosphatase or phosphodiesterase